MIAVGWILVMVRFQPVSGGVMFISRKPSVFAGPEKGGIHPLVRSRLLTRRSRRRHSFVWPTDPSSPVVVAALLILFFVDKKEFNLCLGGQIPCDEGFAHHVRHPTLCSYRLGFQHQLVTGDDGTAEFDTIHRQ